MLIGVFELLADARTQIASVNGAIQALRDFWIAQADLDMALIGKPSLAAAAGPAMAAEAARSRASIPRSSRCAISGSRRPTSTWR